MGREKNMLELVGVSKKFKEFSLREISFTVQRGDYFILLGESGAGKSIVLETIAGLISPDHGRILMNGKDITKEKIQKRRVGLVFQDHAIFPHLTVGANIGYSLHGSALSSVEKKQKIQNTADALGIGGLLHRRPSTLSGGELQRVGLARTLIQQPEILLLDEPLSSLDTRIKADLRNLLHKIHLEGQTILHVTHDYEEALALGTRIAVIHDGTIIQQGEPEEVFANPGSEFVAHFTGAKNFFKAHSSSGPEGTLAEINEKTRFRIGKQPVSGPGYAMIREEDIFLSLEPITSSATNNFKGRIERITRTSRGIDVMIDTGVPLHALITQESLASMDLREGISVWIHFKATAVRFIHS